jgi:sugar-specific transcriptional regulator TrmB
MIPSKPVTYSPVPAAELIERIRRRTADTLEYLDRQLGALERAPQVEVIRHIRGEEHIAAEMVSVAEQAQAELWVAVWEPQVGLLLEPARAAQERGVSVFSVIFDDPASELGLTFRHSYMPPDVVQARLGGHLTIVARDGQEVVIAEFIEPANSWAVKTRDPALVLIATDYIRHDIMFDVIVPRFGVDRLDSIWRNDPNLVHVLTGRRPAASARGDARGRS